MDRSHFKKGPQLNWLLCHAMEPPIPGRQTGRPTNNEWNVQASREILQGEETYVSKPIAMPRMHGLRVMFNMMVNVPGPRI